GRLASSADDRRVSALDQHTHGCPWRWVLVGYRSCLISRYWVSAGIRVAPGDFFLLFGLESLKIRMAKDLTLHLMAVAAGSRERIRELASKPCETRRARIARQHRQHPRGARTRARASAKDLPARAPSGERARMWSRRGAPTPHREDSPGERGLRPLASP